jgi:hypothetical protein
MTLSLPKRPKFLKPLQWRLSFNTRIWEEIQSVARGFLSKMRLLYQSTFLTCRLVISMNFVVPRTTTLGTLNGDI